MIRPILLLASVALALFEAPLTNAAVAQQGSSAGVSVTVTSTVAVGARPNGAAVDPLTHTAYIANRGSNTVSVIHGTDSRVGVTIPVGNGPGGIGVDSGLHKVFVANRDSNTVSVLDEVTNQVTATIGTGDHPEGLAVDPTTHTVYVANSGGGSVSVIDGATGQVATTVPTGSSPEAVAVDMATHAAYVTNDNPGGSTVVVLDGSTHQQIGGFPIGGGPQFVAVDSTTHTVYVTDANRHASSPVGGLAVLTTTANLTFNAQVTYVKVGDNPLGVATDPAVQTAYVANSFSNTVSAVDEATNQVTATVAVGTRPWAVAVDPTTHTVYVANQDSNDVTILNGVSQPSSVPHDNRYFPQTGYRIDNDTIWDYFQRRGGVPTFGYPTSRTFLFQGFTVQFFQRRIVQLGPDGQARLLNLLDPGLLPYTSFNFSTFPGVDSGLVATAPDPTDQPAVLAWVAQHAPDVVAGAPVNFDATFASTVPAQTAFPNGGDTGLLPGIDLEMWGVPTSQPMMDANNHNFIYLRWQRGIMMYDASCTCTQGVLLADYLKAILTGQNLPADLAREAASSPFLNQYDPGTPHWVHNPSLLPDTDLTNAFTPE